MKILRRSAFPERLIRLAYGLIGLFIIALTFLNPLFSYPSQPVWNKAALLLIGLVGVIVLARIVPHREIRHAARTVAVIGLCFLALQCVLVRSYYFYTGWDAGKIIDSAAQAAYGETIAGHYFSRYPNNILLTYLISRVFRLCLRVGINLLQAYSLLLIMQCVISFAAGQMVFHTARRLTGEDRAAMVAYLLYLLLIGLSPWVSIPYSDSAALAFPIGIVALYSRPCDRPLRRGLKWVALGLLAYVGYRIKPTVFITLIALILYEMSAAVRDKSWRRADCLLPACLGILAGVFLVAHAVDTFGYEVEKEEIFGPAHFLAMGLSDNVGGYSDDDVKFSGSFDTAKERRDADLELARSRIREKGLTGMLQHISRKTLYNYTDGSFAWALEGTFFKGILPRDDGFSAVVRSVYYPDGENYRLFLNAETALWLAVLSLSFCSVLSPQAEAVSPLTLTLIGMFCYSVLFEARARYQFIFAPLYIVLAACGLLALEKRRRARKSNGDGGNTVKT